MRCGSSHNTFRTWIYKTALFMVIEVVTVSYQCNSIELKTLYIPTWKRSFLHRSIDRTCVTEVSYLTVSNLQNILPKLVEI
jgi:hypothetical protein